MHIIEELAQQGLDFIPNHYNCIITSPFLEPYGGQLNMRITSVTVPERKIETYDITKRGRTFSRPKGSVEQDRDITITFRPDKYMNCYKKIQSWMQYIQDNRTAFMGSDSGVNGMGGISTFRGVINIYTLDSLESDKSANALWVGEGAFPTTLSNIELSEDSDEPSDVDVTFNCFNIVYPEI